MALASGSITPERSERNFFVFMALLLATTIVGGFGSWALRGMVVGPVPPLVHVHGMLFLFWIGLFITQTALIQRNDVRRHQRVGWAALGVAVAMLIVGSATAVESVQLDRVPPFFTPSIFLALSFLELASFASLLGAAILLRRYSDWHRRLILGANIAILGPAWGRILPMPALGPMGGPTIMGIMLVYVSIGVIFDWRSRGRVHPAYFWVALAILVEGMAIPLLAASPVFTGLAAALAPHP